MALFFPKDLIMSTEIEGQSLLARSELNEATNEFKKKSKKSYTRDFLLSLTQLDICKKLPSGFDGSILHEFDDTSSSILEKQRAPGSVSLTSSTGTKYGSSISTRWDLGKIFQGLCGQYDGVLSGLNNRDSHIQGNFNSDTGRHYGDQSRHPWENPEQDGLIGSGAFSRASGTAEASAPRVQENDQYQLNKSVNPYRPPHFYKEVPDPGVESDGLSTKEASGSDESLNDEGAEEDKKRRDSFKLTRKGQQIVTREKQKQIGYEQEENFHPVNVALSEDLGNDKRLLKESEKYMVLTDLNNSSANSSFPTQSPACGPVTTPHSAGGILEKNLGIKSLIQSPIAKHQDVEADKTQKPLLHSSKFAHWFLEEEKELAGGSLSVNMKDANEGSNGLVTEHNFSSDRNELAPKPVASTLAFSTEGISEQLCGCSKPTVTCGVLTCEDLEGSILTELNEIAAKGWNVRNMGNDQRKSACADDVSKCRYSLLQEAASPKLSMGSSNKKCSSEIESDNTVLNVSAKEITQQFEKNQTLESVLEMGCMKEFQSNQASVFVQRRGSLDRVTRTDISDPSGFPFPVADENIASIAAEYGTIGPNSEGIRPANVCEQTELDMTNQSAFYDDSAEIASNLRMEQKIADPTVEILWPDEDSLIAFDDPVIPQCSKPMPKIASIIRTQHEAKLSPKAGCDETVDSTGEICLPDEDSLIAIDDLIIPEHSVFMHGGNFPEARKLTSYVTVDIAGQLAALNVAHRDEGSTVPGVGNSPFLSGPYNTMGSGIPFHNRLSQQSDPQFHHSHISPGRPSFHSLDSHQAQMHSQTKFNCPKTNHCNPSPHRHSHMNAYPCQTPPAKPKRFYHTVKQSLLQQSINFPSQQTEHELLRGAPLHNPIYQMAAYTQDLNPIQIPNSQQSSYVGFGMPNPGGYEQETYTRQLGPEFWCGQ